MSHKAAKAVRKLLRAGGNDPREVEVTSTPRPMAPAFLGTGPGCMFIPRDLKPNCGRALYLNTKKIGRAAFA